MSGQGTVGDDYVLATGTAAAGRLALLDQVYGPDAQRIISGIGVPPGSRIADIGCGAGHAARWFARSTKAEGEVVALDASPDQLAVARDASEREGLANIRFIEADAYATGLPRGSFDLVHCRFVLCHLRRPLDALNEMAALARPGGVVVCCDLDFDGLFAFPPRESYNRMREIFIEGMKLRGIVPNLGLQLPRMFLEAGLVDPDLVISHPAFMRGEGKRFWEYTFMEGIESRLRNGAVDGAELPALIADWAKVAFDETIGVAQARMPVIWARKPV